MDLSKDKDPIINEKMKKNLVYLSIFSIIMFFAGLSSAYIVLMGDSIWIKAAMPNAFWWSTAMIFLSSMSFIYAITQAKKKQFDLTESIYVYDVDFRAFIHFLSIQRLQSIKRKRHLWNKHNNGF